MLSFETPGLFADMTDGGMAPPSPDPTTRLPPPGALPTTMPLATDLWDSQFIWNSCGFCETLLDHRSPRHSGSVNIDQTDVLDASCKAASDIPRILTIFVANDLRGS